MNAAFWAIQFFVVVFSILIIGAALRPFWNYFRPGNELEVSGSISYLIFFLAVALSCYCTGVNWLVLMTIDPFYPILAAAGRQAFFAFAFEVQDKLVIPGILPASAAFAASGLLLWIKPKNVPLRIAWISASICAAILIISYIPARTQLQMLQRGYSEVIHSRLITMHWICAILFTMHSVLLLYACIRLKVAQS